MKIPLVRQYLFNHAASKLEAMNVNVERELHKSGIRDWRFNAPGSPVPLLHYLKMFDVGVRATSDTEFGTKVALAFDTNDLSTLGVAINRSSTVFGAMKTTCRLASLQASSLNMWITDVGDGYLICRKQFAQLPDTELACAQLEQYTMTLVANIVRQGAGPDWFPKKVFLASSKNGLLFKEDFFPNSTLSFEHPFSAIHVPYFVASKRYPSSGKKQTFEIPSDLSAVSMDWANPEVISSLRAILGAYAMRGGASIETLAEISGLSVRTTQRRLAEHGTNFRRLRNEANAETAKILLSQTDANIAEISETLGYKNAGHFTRGFLSSAGILPKEFRRACQTAGGLAEFDKLL